MIKSNYDDEENYDILEIIKIVMMVINLKWMAL